MADRVEITDCDGRTVDELTASRASMAGYAGDTPWTTAPRLTSKPTRSLSTRDRINP